MAKPRIFVSSTYYDLKYIRAGLEVFISAMGYDAVLFEHGDIPFQFDQSLEDSCYKEVESADMFILIVGGRYGSLSKEETDKIKERPDEFYERLKSVTSREYAKALERDLPTFIFVDASVLSEFSTFKANRSNKTINYAHVDNILIFELIEIIMSQKRNNFVKGFSTIEDITDWLRDQWAGLFADYLRRNVANKQLTSLQQQVKNLSEVAETLKRYNEALINAVGTAESKRLIGEEAVIHRASRANQLINEDLISYLLTSGEKMFRENALEVMEQFEKSKDVVEFMTKIGVSQERSNQIISLFEAEINRDFGNLKANYVSEKTRASRRRTKRQA